MYGTLSGFKTYCDDVGYDYSAFTDPQITQSINLASLKLDAKHRGNWIGERADINQDAEWPRNNAYGSETGRLYDASQPPNAIINSTYELAFQMLSGTVRGVVGDKNEASIKSEKKSLVSGMFKEVEYVSGLSPEDRENQVYDSIAELYLFDLLRRQSGGFTTVHCL